MAHDKEVSLVKHDVSGFGSSLWLIVNIPHSFQLQRLRYILPKLLSNPFGHVFMAQKLVSFFLVFYKKLELRGLDSITFIRRYIMPAVGLQ